MKFTILRFDRLASTNTEALNQARRGADEGVCVVAEQQTAGRGRNGRTWISPKGAGLYFSLILRPQIENEFLPLITLMSAVAVADTLAELYQLPIDIKWANDVHVNEKKICGILAEMTETKIGTAIVVGIGINLTSKNFPSELRQTATSIEAETNAPVDLEILLRTLTGKLDEFYRMLNAENGAARIRAEWARQSSYYENKQVKITLANEVFTGTTRGLEPNGALRVEIDDGAIKIVPAGDVERLRKI